jgi:hypothetical protein
MTGFYSYGLQEGFLLHAVKASNERMEEGIAPFTLKLLVNQPLDLGFSPWGLQMRDKRHVPGKWVSNGFFWHSRIVVMYLVGSRVKLLRPAFDRQGQSFSPRGHLCHALLQ